MISQETLDKVLMNVEKPARYIGHEQNIYIKNKSNMKATFAFAFPDIYDVGMSHLGLHILYNLLNEQDDFYCERVFAPWVDMEKQMRDNNIPLYSLETKTPINEFDFVGFTLQYEMSYTNILNMLDLSNIPLESSNREEGDPFIIAGGPCAYNPEPLADIIDFFVIGEAEETILKVMNEYIKSKEEGVSRKAFLESIVNIPGIYIPSFYKITYNEDNTIREMIPLKDNYPRKIKKVIQEDLDETYFPNKMIVPYIETVHDRVILEIFRGCIRGCRFCQAGMIYRPVRERSVNHLLSLAKQLIKATGHEEISISSLSTSDYSQLETLVTSLIDEYKDQKIGLSLPSLRLDSFSLDMIKEIQKIRKTGLTFAPEAGSQRLRDVINKGINEEDLVKAVRDAFNMGWSTVKLYFMIGLPTETEKDLYGIKDLGYKVKEEFFSLPKEKMKGSLKITISASCFVPKAFTPFQWHPQNTIEEFRKKQEYLKDIIKDRKITYNTHDAKVSFLEAVFARGDRRVSKVLIEAFKNGAKFDGWRDQFKYDVWMKAFKKENVDPRFYANRERNYEEVLPWDFINIGVTKQFLIKENEKAKEGKLTPNCAVSCSGCGITRDFKGGIC
ncbi:TIGR03960 family B12-binding radical SAM protein [Clostridium sp. D2Q-14]|uniref:TIGR03960 family B12-binding radical SAM protein n=1 Tax=Anaeromonas gelatinilytica TaxID=2683194 RepID=UPI00193B907D|nr:TIGR03960 family B12-binding radical SAM protein [Anaeromonas gelatinilytica]MBS4535862.1 TIGR03960 family B12-binding radical SAM protein [Anaeromonas gelatinilytica]